MTVYDAQYAGTSGVTVKVDYSDVAGAFAGWFLLVVQGDNLTEDSDSNPGNGPDSAAKLSTRVDFTAPTSSGGSGAGNSYPYGVASTGAAPYRLGLLTQVNARLERMFGVGHTAKWSATVVQSVTPAVVDDNW